MKSAPDENAQELVAAAGLLGVAIFFFICGCILVWFSCLRETREFWFNSGGYPELLRDVVRVFYYPLMIFTIFGLLAVSIVLCAKIRLPLSFLCFETFLLLACWSLVAGSIFISASNNLSNFWRGRPLHYKPPLTSR